MSVSYLSASAVIAALSISHSPPGIVLRDHRSWAALAAISERRSGVSFAARALPPFSPPNRPRRTAAKSRPSSVKTRSSFSPEAISTTSFASSLGSRGRGKRFESVIMCCEIDSILILAMLERIGSRFSSTKRRHRDSPPGSFSAVNPTYFQTDPLPHGLAAMRFARLVLRKNYE
jgi:hypothetical protein